MPSEDIRTVKRRHSPRLLQQAGVSGVGVERDEAGNDVLVLHVSTDEPGVLSALPAELDGYPVRVVHSGPFRALEE